MPVNYVEFAQAKSCNGLRLVVMPGLPSPWSEAAKGILQAKGIPYKALYLDHKNKEMALWTKNISAPIAIYQQEAPVDNWLEILLLAERLEPKNSLLPIAENQKARVLALCQKICAKDGLGWLRRLNSIDKGLKGEQGGFPLPIAQYLGSKYGYQEKEAAQSVTDMIQIITEFSQILIEQKDQGSSYLVADQLSAADIYLATFMAYFSPLSHEHCPMQPAMRDVFESLSPDLKTALDPILIEHRDFIYQNHLELPLNL